MITALLWIFGILLFCLCAKIIWVIVSTIISIIIDIIGSLAIFGFVGGIIFIIVLMFI